MLSEQQIEEAIKAVSAAMAADFPEAYEEPVHEFSPEFEKKIEELVRELRERPRRKWLQRAASVAVTIALLGGIWYGIGSEARASIVGWVREQYETFFHYFYEGDSSGPVSEAEYELGWLPDGYEFVDKLEANEWPTLIYINDNGNILKFCYNRNPETAEAYLINEECEIEQIEIDGVLAEVHLYKDENISNDIILKNSENVLFVISAQESKRNLVKMVENIKKNQ